MIFRRRRRFVLDELASGINITIRMFFYIFLILMLFAMWLIVKLMGVK